MSGGRIATSASETFDLAGTRALASGGRIDLALGKLSARLARFPDDVGALVLLGDLSSAVGRQDEAERSYRRALSLDDRHAAARRGLAATLYRAARAADALATLRPLLDAGTRHPTDLGLEAAILAALGDHAASLAVYDQLEADGVANPRHRLGRAQQLRTLGRPADAEIAIRHLVALDDPESRAARPAAWWALADLKTGSLNADDRRALTAALRDPRLGPDSRVFAHYALGKALEDSGDLLAGFDEYAAGAALLRRRSRYSAAETTSFVRGLAGALTSDLIAPRSPERGPIFIIGLPRAGSTLVEQILASHPLVEATSELVEMPLLAREHGLEPPASDPRRLATLSDDDVAGIGQAYLDRTRVYRKTSRPFFVDKLPNNWLSVGLILRALPTARIVDVRRGPLAVGVSAFKQLFAQGQAFSYDLADLGSYYRDNVALMRHVDAVAPGAVHHLMYEHLVDDPEREIGRLLDHCGLPFDPACLAFHRTDRPIWTPSAAQVRRPLYRTARDSWQAVEARLQPMKAALGPVLDRWQD